MQNNLRIHKLLPSLDTLVCFEAVARTGSFTRASLELSLTQGAVSKQIKSLEEALRCTLFERNARGVHLTGAGAIFLEDMSVILHKLERTVLKTRAQQEKQAVSIICTQAVAHHWLFPRIVKFNQKYPDIMVRVISNNGINELSCNESDFGILYGNGNWPSLDHAPLFPEIVYPICKYNFEIKKPQTLKNIAALPLIQLDSRKWDCIDWRDWFWHFNIDYITPQNALTFNEVTLSFNAAIEGLGVCLGWDFMVKPALEKKLIERFGQFEFNTKKFDYLVHTKNKPLSKTAIIFREWLLNSI